MLGKRKIGVSKLEVTDGENRKLILTINFRTLEIEFILFCNLFHKIST